MCPQAPRSSPEYSHKAGLQTVITEKPLQIGPVIHSAARGILQWAEFHVGLRVGRGVRQSDLVVGLRLAACWTKGGNCRSFRLRWCSEIGEGIEQRVASSPSPQHWAGTLTETLVMMDRAWCWPPPLRWRSFRLRCRPRPGQIPPKVETMPRVLLLPLLMSEPAGRVCL